MIFVLVSQFHVYILHVFSLAQCFYSVLNAIALVAAFNHGRAIEVGRGLLRVKSL